MRHCVQDVTQSDEIQFLNVASNGGNVAFEKRGVVVVEHAEPLDVGGELGGGFVLKISIKNVADLIEHDVTVFVQVVTVLDEATQDGGHVLSFSKLKLHGCYIVGS